jgi:hypothetical protein
MRKLALAILMATSLFIGLAGCETSQKVEIVVVGFTEHGPLQPTVRAVQNVAAKYGEQVKLIILSSNTEAGSKYMVQHKLTAHLNVMIDGKYQYLVRGKRVVFQWFEGNLWTKEDLDAVIGSLINQKQAAKK